jgi:hypothetical protein
MSPSGTGHQSVALEESLREESQHVLRVSYRKRTEALLSSFLPSLSVGRVCRYTFHFAALPDADFVFS